MDTSEKVTFKVYQASGPSGQDKGITDQELDTRSIDASTPGRNNWEKLLNSILIQCGEEPREWPETEQQS